MLRMIGVPLHKSHTNSNALHVVITKITLEKCVEHLNCAVLTSANQELTRFAVKPHTHRHRNHLFCRTWPTTKRTQSNKTSHKQCGHPHCLKRTHPTWKNNICVTFNRTQTLSEHKEKLRTSTKQETPRTEKCATPPQLQNRDWMFIILIGLNRTSFDLEM